MNIDAIIKALREAYGDTDSVYFSLRTILKDAADTIETLVTQRDEARKDCAVAEKNHMDADFELSSLKNEKSHMKNIIKRMTDRLEISPYGDDKVDELQESNDNLRFQIEQLKGGKWINPRKELPKSGESVVVILDTGDVQEAFYSTKSNAWIKDTGFMVIPEVTHWMPFPEPTKD